MRQTASLELVFANNPSSRCAFQEVAVNRNIKILAGVCVLLLAVLAMAEAQGNPTLAATRPKSTATSESGGDATGVPGNGSTAPAGSTAQGQNNTGQNSTSVSTSVVVIAPTLVPPTVGPTKTPLIRITFGSRATAGATGVPGQNG